MQKEIKRKVRTYAVAAVLLALILGIAIYNFGLMPKVPLTLASPLKAFSSEAELKSFLESNANKTQYAPTLATDGSLSSWIPSLANNTNATILQGSSNAVSSSSGLAVTPGISDYTSFPTSPSFSTTNVQVAGVDELDTVKTDGTYIYTVSGNAVFIVNASLPDAGVVSRIDCQDFVPAGIFVSANRLTIIGSNYSYPEIIPYAPASTPVYGIPEYGMYLSQIQTYVRVYDVSDKANPTLLKNVTMTGNYFDSRMIGNYVYFVTTTPSYLVNDTVVLPDLYSNGTVSQISATEIYYSNVSDAYLAYSTLVALNTQNPSENPTTLTVMTGQASNMYVALDNIYITFPAATGDTTVYRIQMQDNTMTAMAEGQVPGQILNQFSMDENGQYFRVATTSWFDEPLSVSPTNPVSTPIVMSLQSTNVYVLNMNLTIVGRLENISAGENFHSARFVGDTCYLVTFEMTDPLFVVSLSDPTSPKILGNLTVSGYSDYLQPYDQNHLIGIGKETSTAENGFFAWYQGIKIAMFDVSNVSNPLQTSNVTIGDRGSDSPVLYDHRALLFDKQTDLLVIPIAYAQIDASQWPSNEVPESEYGTQIWQGVYVYNITIANGLVLKGNVTHAETTGMPPSNLTVDRALYIGNVLYTVSQDKIMLNSLTDLSQLKEINLG